MENVTKTFGATRALDDVTLELRRGEVHALIGENGAGKSTMMKILSGAIRPDSGRMTVDGEPYRPLSPLEGLRRGISMIYQELNLAPHLTVEENILLGREPHARGWLRRREMRRKVRQALEFVHHGEISPDSPVKKLSIGARQIVEIARALLNRALILVMDEPTSSLNQEDSRELFAIIGKLKTQGVSVIYISHFLEEVQKVADSYTVLRDGRNVGSGPMAGTSLEDLVQLMVGQKVAEMFPRVAHSRGEPVVSLVGLKGAAMPAAVSLGLKKGEILGVAGLVGSGRTELLRAVFGLDRLEAGCVIVSGVETVRGTPWARLEQGFGLLSEDRQGEGLALGQSLADNLTLSDFSPYVRRGWLSVRRQHAAAAGWIDRIKIKTQGPGAKAGSLSGGNQQKVALARLLHQKADIFLLDEPTRGIDVVSKSQIYELIGNLARDGREVVFVSSYFPELLGVCDRIAVFHRGAVVDTREAGEWDAQSLMSAATVGRPADF